MWIKDNLFKCERCGKLFLYIGNSYHKNIKYCSERCYLISNSYYYKFKHLGTGNLQERAVRDENGNIDFEKEYQLIRREMGRLGLLKKEKERYLKR